MNIQALLGTRPAAGSPRRPGATEKGRDRDRASAAGAGGTHDIVELSTEGKQRAAADSEEDQS